MYIAGVDVGNHSTEAALGKFDGSAFREIWSGIARTTGIKGTKENLPGILSALSEAAKAAGIVPADIALIRMNEAAPVLGDFAMETITETVITESTMIGHNPDTPGGLGLGVGETISIAALSHMELEKDYVVIVPGAYDFAQTAKLLSEKMEGGYRIVGAILKNDDGVLVSNRLNRKIPIVDEVKHIEKVPSGAKCAVEVAPVAGCIDHLANPYGIAALFNLTAEETRQVVQIARALIGNRSAVIVKTPAGSVKERKIPAGELVFYGGNKTCTVDVQQGAAEIMKAMDSAGALQDVEGSPGTNAGGMMEGIRQEMSRITGRGRQEVFIKDVLAVDTLVPQNVSGSLSNEISLEQAVGLAAMVKTDKLHMEKLANALARQLGVPVEIGGVEGEMAVLGALTTPGTERPILMADVGAGSIDVCYMNESGKTNTIHLAGAGDMTAMLIGAELSLSDPAVAEEIKRYPLAKVESLFHIRHEDGSVEFFQEPLSNDLFARVAVIRPDGLSPLPLSSSMEKIRQVRRNAKQKVLLENLLRGLKKISPTGRINAFETVVLVGGSSLDFEYANMVTEALARFGITGGKGNVRGTEGPRNAVATGLLLSYERGRRDGKAK